MRSLRIISIDADFSMPIIISAFLSLSPIGRNFDYFFRLIAAFLFAIFLSFSSFSARWCFRFSLRLIFFHSLPIFEDFSWASFCIDISWCFLSIRSFFFSFFISRRRLISVDFWFITCRHYVFRLFRCFFFFFFIFWFSFVCGRGRAFWCSFDDASFDIFFLDAGGRALIFFASIW